MGKYDLSGAIILRDAFSGTFDKLQGGIGGVSTSFKTVAAAVGGALAGMKVAESIGEMVNLATEMEEVRGVFDNLTKAAGVNSNQMLVNLRTASRGMTSDLDLLRSANRAYLADNQEVFRNLDTIYKAAAIGADALGLSVTQAFDEMTQAIAVQQSRALKRFGINVDASEANEAYAKSMGTVASKLTSAQKEAAFAQEAIRQLDDLIKRSGDTALSTADKIDIYRASVVNMKTAMGDALVQSGLVADFYSRMATVITGLSTFGMGLEQLGAVDFLTRLSQNKDKMEAINEEFRTGVIDINQWKYAMMDALGVLYGGGTPVPKRGIHTELPPLGGGLKNPSPTFGGHPDAGAYFTYTNSLTDGADLQEFITDKAEEEAEAKRRASEYQSVHNSRLQEQRAILDGIRSQAESILTAGVGVTAGDMAATAAGTYEDKPLEAARRLADIANQGMASPWAKVLIPPPEVVAAGDAAVKAWASKTQGQVENLTRPDLIDWDAFTRNFEQAQQDEAAKQVTLDIAIGKLDAAGLLNGVSPDERKRQVAQAMGLDSGLFASFDFGAELTTALDADFKANDAGFKAVGKLAGGSVGTAFNEAMLANTGDILYSLAMKVSPVVADILSSKESGSGGKP